jgi:hypothetical protein
MVNGLKIALLTVLLSSALNARADDSDWSRSANIDLQSRFFTQDAKWPGQSSQTGAVSLAFSAEFRWRDPDADQRISLIPYLRWDATDSDRSLVDLPEAYWAFEGDSYELLVGANTVFWGVTESVHLVDIINQTDAVADIDGEYKLGQPMLNLELQRDWGLIGLYAMPYSESVHSLAATAASGHRCRLILTRQCTNPAMSKITSTWRSATATTSVTLISE